MLRIIYDAAISGDVAAAKTYLSKAPKFQPPEARYGEAKTH